MRTLISDLRNFKHATFRMLCWETKQEIGITGNLPIALICIDILTTKSRDRAVSIATGYGLDDQWVGVRVPMGARIFSSPYRPDRLWNPPSLLSNGYWGLFLQELSGRGVNLTTHLQLVPRSRKRGSIHPLPYTSSWYSA
jgi:hypothetical protein